MVGGMGISYFATLILQSREHHRCVLSVSLYFPRLSLCFGMKSSNVPRSRGLMAECGREKKLI